MNHILLNTLKVQKQLLEKHISKSFSFKEVIVRLKKDGFHFKDEWDTKYGIIQHILDNEIDTEHMKYNMDKYANIIWHIPNEYFRDIVVKKNTYDAIIKQIKNDYDISILDDYTR